MTSSSKPIKTILSKYFFSFWRSNNHKFPKYSRDSIFENVMRFLECGDPNLGYTSFICLKCKAIHKTPFSCKSRFCSSCGRNYSEAWASNIANSLIDCQHRHATFSLPKGWIRDFFFKNRYLLKELAEASYLALKYSFKKLGILNFGSISTIHTFSRTIEWNPHIHSLVTFGGITKNNQWKNIKNLPWQVLRKSWQKCVLDIIAKYAKANDSQYLKNKISLAYRKYKEGFYVNAESKVGNSKFIAKYIGRYLARPAIAEYRIISFNDKTVTFWFEDLVTKKKRYLTLTIEKFIGRILSHIPPKTLRWLEDLGFILEDQKIKYPRK